MGKRKTVDITIGVEYSTGKDEPSRGIFRNQAIQPSIDREIAIAIREHEPEDVPVFIDNPTQKQVHLIGTARGLEQLGAYLIALARLETSDPEPYGSFDDVLDVDGGTIRLLPRRVSTPIR